MWMFGGPPNDLSPTRLFEGLANRVVPSGDGKSPSCCQILLVVPEKDMVMHLLPTEEQEAQSRIDYMNYASHDPDNSALGTVAARTVKDVGHCLFCHVMRQENIMAFEPMTAIPNPVKKTFSYIAATDEACREPKYSRTCTRIRACAHARTHAHIHNTCKRNFGKA